MFFDVVQTDIGVCEVDDIALSVLATVIGRRQDKNWIITDAVDHVEEVKGPGVIGEQPVLAPGASYKYSSWCPLKTPTGLMRGTYQMAGKGGKLFDIEIAPFGLRAKYRVN